MTMILMLSIQWQMLVLYDRDTGASDCQVLWNERQEMPAPEALEEAAGFITMPTLQGVTGSEKKPSFYLLVFDNRYTDGII